MVCAHHQFSTCKDLAVPLIRNADPDNLLWCTPLTRLFLSQYINSILPRSCDVRL
jgi:hypothetical protein